LLKCFIVSFPDNAFQKNVIGTNWNLTQRVAAMLVGGMKLASVGMISSIGAGVASEALYGARSFLNPSVALKDKRRRTPIFKSAAVYGCFLGNSANLRYQVCILI
jgi:Protein RETICULATA-related